MACTLVMDPLLVDVRDALLKSAHLRRQRRLGTDGARDAAEKGGNLRPGLREAENVVDEEKNVLLLLVAKVFRDGERRERDPCAGARRLVHLAVDQSRLADDGLARLQLGLRHFDEKVVALACSLADARKAADAAVRFRDVVDEFLNEYGLTDAGAAEKPDLAAPAVGREKVDDLDARLEDFDFRRLLDELRGRPMDGRAHLGLHRGAVVDRVTDDVENAAEALGPDRHRDGAARVSYGHSAHEPVGRVHRDGADRVFTEMLRHLEREVVLRVRNAGIRQFEGVEDLRQFAVGELDVDDVTDDLDDFAVSGGRAVRADGKRIWMQAGTRAGTWLPGASGCFACV